MRGFQIADEPRSIQIRPSELAAAAPAAELIALQNTEMTVLARRADVSNGLRRLRIARGGLREIEGGDLEVLGGLRGQIAKRDKLLAAGTLDEAGKADVQRQTRELLKRLDATDAQIAMHEAELSKVD